MGSVALRDAGNDDDPHRSVDPDTDATGLLSLLLGLSIAILLEQTTPTEATEVLDRHLDRLAR